MQTLESDLLQGIQSIDTVLGQCMYFGLSFSRAGADFRGLMAPIFTKVILANFQSSIHKVTHQFEDDIDSYTLINKIPTTSLNQSSQNIIDNEQHQQQQNDNLAPPESLLDYQPLAIYCNGILTTFNELRHCSPTALANDVTICLQTSLEHIARNILNFYRQEQQAFSSNERENLVKFCACFAYDLVPYMQKCIHVLFAPNVVTSYLGINAIALQKEGITYLKQKRILEPIEHLLPDKVEAIILNVKQERTGGNHAEVEAFVNAELVNE